MRTLLLCLLSTTLALAPLSATAKGALKDIPIDTSFSETSVNWSNDAGKMDIMWGLVQMEGRLWVCGAVRYPGSRTFIANRAILRKGWVRSGSAKGKKVMTDLSFFKDMKGRKSFDGAMATCRNSGQKPVDSRYFMGFEPTKMRM